MKKIILFISIFIFSISSAFAGSYYPNTDENSIDSN